MSHPPTPRKLEEHIGAVPHAGNGGPREQGGEPLIQEEQRYGKENAVPHLTAGGEILLQGHASPPI
jgi:hypothetical protein